ncbi:MAG: Flp pilus assembly complex ATPase component TadA, partial [Sandarakinorhabdus sp.]|nr:Flp pilus assembly complex ATPase component TadA [Sandarakinorhabdus sp.]
MTRVAEIGGDGVYLRSFLQPLEPWLGRADVTEILINRPQEIWIERNGAAAMERTEVPELTVTALGRLVAQVARTNHQGINRAQPLLSGLLPGGERIQIIAPPATRAHIAIAIRKLVQVDIDLADYAAAGAFSGVRIGEDDSAAVAEAALRLLLAAGDIMGFLVAAVAQRKNILVSGGTSSG